MSCHHNNRRSDCYTSAPRGTAYTGRYWVCADCGLVHMEKVASFSHLMIYYPDRISSVFDRLRNSANPDITDLWTGKYPEKETAEAI